MEVGIIQKEYTDNNSFDSYSPQCLEYKWIIQLNYPFALDELQIDSLYIPMPTYFKNCLLITTV